MIELTIAEKRVYMAIKSKPFTSHKQKDLELKLKLSRDVVQKAVRKLVTVGLIEKATFDKASYVFSIKSRPIRPDLANKLSYQEDAIAAEHKKYLFYHDFDTTLMPDTLPNHVVGSKSVKEMLDELKKERRKTKYETPKEHKSWLTYSKQSEEGAEYAEHLTPAEAIVLRSRK